MARTTVLSAVVFVSAMFGAGSANAEAQLFSLENYGAWLDVRAVTADGEKAWLNNGFGKLRYGDESKLDLAQAAVNWKPRFADTVTGYVLAQYTPGTLTEWGVSEAFVKWKPVPTNDWRYSVRLGQMFPPVSMEHDGPGWSVSRTLTPSAINSWIGEEVLADALEGSVQTTVGGHTLGVTAALFTGNDTSATILTWRGWALHDIASDRDTRLPLPDDDEQGWYKKLGDANQDPYTEPLAEVDGHMGDYVRLDWRPPAPVAVNFEYYANNADPQVLRHKQWGWDTRFYNLGLTARLSPKDELLSQYMTGSTRMGWQMGRVWAFDMDFDSAYVLLSHALDGGAKLTGRVDYFAAKDFSMRAVDDNMEKGYSATLAYIRPVNAHMDFAVEGVTVASNRPARMTRMLDPRQSQTQLQLALKLHL
jgi:hypothetical protein